MKPWQSTLNFLTTKTSLWLPFTAQMEPQIFHFFKPSLTFPTMSCLSDFNSKLEAFGCTSKNDSGPILKPIQNKLNLIYLNNYEHTYMDWRNGNTDILDMAFITPNLAIHDLQFQIGVDLGSDHLPIEISIDTTPHWNTFTNHTRYKFDQTDREVFKSILEEALSSEAFLDICPLVT